MMQKQFMISCSRFSCPVHFLALHINDECVSASKKNGFIFESGMSFVKQVRVVRILSNPPL